MVTTTTTPASTGSSSLLPRRRRMLMLCLLVFASATAIACWIFGRTFEQVGDATTVVEKANNATTFDSTLPPLNDMDKGIVAATTTKKKNQTSTTNTNTNTTTTRKDDDVNININTDTKNKKWLLYFTESGWSNQMKCLEHAYYIARKLNRGILLPPVLPHMGKGGTIPRNVFGLDSAHFKTGVSVQNYYLKKLPASKYVPLHHVLDVDYSFPVVADASSADDNNNGVTMTTTTMTTMDVKEYFDSHDAQMTSSSSWVLETEYDHFNTKWMYQRSDLEGRQEVLERVEYGIPRILNMTYRDIATALNETQSNATILVFMDTFKTQFEPTSMMEPPFRPRFSEPIRSAARRIRDGWNSTPHSIKEYAAVHIRGSDGKYKTPERFTKSITAAVDQISVRLQDWILGDQKKGGATDAVSSVGLFVATDVFQELKNHSVFQKKTKDLIDTIQRSHGVTVQLLWGPSSSSSLEANNNNDTLKEYVRYAELFLDQQLAACALIGFVGTSGSTFTQLIETLRHDEAC
jgi:hypothetical protein